MTLFLIFVSLYSLNSLFFAIMGCHGLWSDGQGCGSDDYRFCFWVVGRGLMVRVVGPMIVSFDFGLWVVV